MKVLDPVGALGCVGADEVLAVLTEADDRRREQATVFQLDESRERRRLRRVF